MTSNFVLTAIAIMVGGIVGNYVGVSLGFPYGGFVGAAAGGILALYNAYRESEKR
ncbi:MAG TPA: hypothetical protein QF572_20485 [Vicinamibacterales bacterium]|jgi:uncharacterized protein YcfJ|nr:hypothetical protein [Vicinamibacterales bacterium]|tara:strand:+ start:449 stop:613 length:165 start_codon:yes stop_codon:yes gene_type:complete